MAYDVLKVDPQGYTEAGTKASQAATEIETAANSALRSLSGLAHMGGNDEAGGKFAHAYDKQAKAVFELLGDLCSALSQTTSAFDASAISHAAAEWASAGNAGDPPGYSQPSDPIGTVFPAPASAYGGTNIFPQGWTFIQDLVSGTWPDGDTDKMHTATKAWNDLADDLDRTRGRHISTLLDSLDGFQAPDIAAIQAATAPLGDGLKKAADACRGIADLSSEYAKNVVDTHTEAGNELAQFVITSAAAIGIGALLTPFTAGISDLVGGGAVAADAAVTAADVSTTLANLLTKVGSIIAKVIEISKGASGVSTFLAKSAVFGAKSAYSGTIWAGANVAGDYAVNGKVDWVGDLGDAYIGGFIGDAFAGAGETAISKISNGAIRESDEAASGVNVGDGIPNEEGTPATEGSARDTASGPQHSAAPRHAASLPGQALSGATKTIPKVVGGALGNVAAQYLNPENQGQVNGGKVVEGGIDALIPVVPGKTPQHLGPRPIRPTIPIPDL